uniref:Uncharacterized protein n=1 Tax=Biomphalaria glabrata TaxID=6526 RepID=A0A2C9M8N2_BIOGL
MNKVANNKKDNFLEISRPAIIWCRKLVTSTTLLKNLPYRSSIQGTYSKTVPVKLVDNYTEFADKDMTALHKRIASKNVPNVVPGKRNQIKKESEAPPNVGIWLDVKGKSLHLIDNDEPTVKRRNAETRKTTKMIQLSSGKLPKSRSDSEFGKQRCRLDNSASSLPVKTWFSGNTNDFRVLGSSEETSPECEIIHCAKRQHSIRIRIPSGEPDSEANHDFWRLRDDVSHPIHSRRCTAICDTAEKSEIRSFSRQQDRSAKGAGIKNNNSHAMKYRKHWSPLSSLYNERSLRPPRMTYVDRDAEDIPALIDAQTNNLGHCIETHSSTNGPWSSARSKTDYILQWLADVNAKRKT